MNTENQKTEEQVMLDAFNVLLDAQNTSDLYTVSKDEVINTVLAEQKTHLDEQDKLAVLEKLVSELIAAVERPEGTDYCFEERNLEDLAFSSNECEYIQSLMQ